MPSLSPMASPAQRHPQGSAAGTRLIKGMMGVVVMMMVISMERMMAAAAVAVCVQTACL